MTPDAPERSHGTTAHGAQNSPMPRSEPGSAPSRASPEAPRPRRVVLCLLGAGVTAAALAASGIADRARSKQEVADWTDVQAIPSVRLVSPRRGQGGDMPTFPGTVSAYEASSLFARASGYITAWRYDIGARVKKGTVLAIISAPDLDQQLAQARAELGQLKAAVAQAQANADLGDAVNARTTKMVVKGWSSKEQGDTDRLTALSRQAALAVAKAQVETQAADVARLEELTGFERVVAPFDGVITARNIDVGDMVQANAATGRPLFQIADTHRMRIYVSVPQALLGRIKPGTTATLHLPGRPDTVKAELASTSNAFSEASRTASVEFQADNADGELWPGAFADVQFDDPPDPHALDIPATALLFGPHGLQVAVVDKTRRVALKPVTLGRNFGDRVSIEAGLSPTDRLIDASRAGQFLKRWTRVVAPDERT